MAARTAAKKSSKWFSDPSVYPLFLCISAGSVLGVSVGVRHLTTSPDVHWDRETRKSKELIKEPQTSWMAHREGIKNLRPNAVNTHINNTSSNKSS